MSRQSADNNGRKAWGEGPAIISNPLGRPRHADAGAGCSWRTSHYRLPAERLADNMIELARQTARALLN